MATETKKIIVRKGLSAQLPDLDEGEPGFTTDTQKLYVGTSGTTNIELSKEGHTHTISNVTDLQTSLDGKVGTSDSRLTDARTPLAHTHGNITNGGLIGTAANLPIITGTGGILQAGSFGTTANTFTQGNDARLSDARNPLAHEHTLSNITDAGTIAAVNLNNNGAQFLKGDGTFGIPTVAAGSAEWTYIGGTTVSNGTIVVNSDVISGGFDLATYDYKFAVVMETNEEDNTSLYIRINNFSDGFTYRYLYTRIIAGTNETLVFSQNTSTLISLGVLLPGDNTGVAYTNVETEFVLSRSYSAFSFSGTDAYNYIVRGQGVATAMNAPVANTIYPLISNFMGNIQLTQAVTSLEIVHDITAGTTDTAKVRVYRRAK
jgi:hypothetical protein